MSLSVLSSDVHARANYLKANHVFASLSPESLHSLAEQALPTRVRRGATLWHEGDPSHKLVQVVRGRLLAHKLSLDGNVAYFRISTAGDLLGLSSLARVDHRGGGHAASPTHQTTVTARDECIVLTIECSVVQALMAEESALTRRILWEMQHRIQALIDDLFAERTQRGALVLANKLLQMAAMEGTTSGRVHLDYSQAELAGFTGLSSRNINKFLAELPAVTTSNGRRGVRIERVEHLQTFVRNS
ncbi:Crp/Fnr family transcriptional regulator [Haliangium sp.]|uniref:Crp/Fnr family transcriptional regulator n=1 Tax=Haliangium sp. TaxID=2663208 RepID=UPI003D1520DF